MMKVRKKGEEMGNVKCKTGSEKWGTGGAGRKG